MIFWFFLSLRTRATSPFIYGVPRHTINHTHSDKQSSLNHTHSDKQSSINHTHSDKQSSLKHTSSAWKQNKRSIIVTPAKKDDIQCSNCSTQENSGRSLTHRQRSRLYSIRDRWLTYKHLNTRDRQLTRKWRSRLNVKRQTTDAQTKEVSPEHKRHRTDAQTKGVSPKYKRQTTHSKRKEFAPEHKR